MATHHVVTDSRAQDEARLLLGIALVCASAVTAFVLVPYYVEDLTLPSGVDALWMLATMMSVILGPVAAGLAGYASFVSLWLHGDELPTHARRLHLVTLLVAALSLGLLVTIGADLFSSWAD